MFLKSLIVISAVAAGLRGKVTPFEATWLSSRSRSIVGSSVGLKSLVMLGAVAESFRFSGTFLDAALIHNYILSRSSDNKEDLTELSVPVIQKFGRCYLKYEITTQTLVITGSV